MFHDRRPAAGAGRGLPPGPARGRLPDQVAPVAGAARRGAGPTVAFLSLGAQRFRFAGASFGSTADQPLHGYGIIRAVAELSDGDVQLRAGTLYGALERLTEQGHIGAEIVTTLLEMAGDEQSRPTGADSWHLVLSGLRQRFRLPFGRPLVWLAAVLITLVAVRSGWPRARGRPSRPSPTCPATPGSRP